MNNLELKIAALRESLAQKVTDYEDRIADLRVSLTMVSNERDKLKGLVEKYENEREDADAEDEAE